MNDKSKYSNLESINSKDVKCTSIQIGNYKKNFIYFLILILLLISWFNFIDKKVENYIDQTMISALVSFGTARGINAAISVVKSAEISAMFVSADVGKVLDPVDDMVEDFSTIMKLSLASIISQKIIIEIVSSNFFKILLTIGGLLFIATILLGLHELTNNVFKIFLVVSVLRFLLIFVLAASSFADSAFLKEQTEAEVQKFQKQGKEFQAAQQEAKFSKEERAELSEELSQQREQRKDIQHQIEEANQSLQKSQKKLLDAEEKLKDASKGRSILDDLNFIKEENPEYKSAKKAQKAATEEVEKWSDRLEQLIEKIEEKNDYIKEVKAILSGENESFHGEMRRKIYGIKKALSLHNIKQTTQNFMDTSIRLIALFMIKTIILPLVFLYAGIKGFEKIWKIDLLNFTREKWKEGREMLTEKQSDQSEGHA